MTAYAVKKENVLSKIDEIIIFISNNPNCTFNQIEVAVGLTSLGLVFKLSTLERDNLIKVELDNKGHGKYNLTGE